MENIFIQTQDIGYLQKLIGNYFQETLKKPQSKNSEGSYNYNILKNRNHRNLAIFRLSIDWYAITEDGNMVDYSLIEFLGIQHNLKVFAVCDYDSVGVCNLINIKDGKLNITKRRHYKDFVEGFGIEINRLKIFEDSLDDNKSITFNYKTNPQKNTILENNDWTSLRLSQNLKKLEKKGIISKENMKKCSKKGSENLILFEAIVVSLREYNLSTAKIEDILLKMKNKKIGFIILARLFIDELEKITRSDNFINLKHDYSFLY